MRTKFDKNEVVILDEHAEIILYDKHNMEKARAVIDISMADMVRNAKWYLRPDGYVATNNYNGIGYTYLHDVVLANKQDETYCDHINGNRLDNRMSNLRRVTPTQNGMNKRIRSNNTSGRVGVHWSKHNQKWCAMIGFGGQHINLGYYECFEDAVAARDDAEQRHFGQFKPSKERTIRNDD